VVVAGANINDFKLLRQTLESVVISRPAYTQHLCLDKGYDNAIGYLESLINGYQPHIRQIGEEKLDEHGEKALPARRWVVERTIGWLSKCHALLVRLDKKARNYLGLIQLDCMLIWYRRCWRLGLLR